MILQKYQIQKELLAKYFEPAIYKISKYSLKYFAVSDNYKLDEYCQIFYEYFKENPYFVNKWYSLDLFHHYIFKELKRANFENKKIVELGAGLGITSAFLKKILSPKNIKLIPIDYQYSACMLINNTAQINNVSKNSVNCNWQYPPLKKIDIVIGIDVIYEISTVVQLLECFDKILGKDSLIYLANFENYAFQTVIAELSKKYKILDCLEKKNSSQKIRLYKIVIF
ncbi:MAG TPA: hypothetical protein PLM75_09120, partial [bacterium]|nr:hypothetical protein [bacterium]